MKKKITLIVCVVCLLAVAMGLMVGCADDEKPGGEKDPIIGTWIGREKAHNRDFYMKIKNQSVNTEKTTFDIEIKEIEHDTLNTIILDVGKITKKDNKYVFEGDLTNPSLNNEAKKDEYDLSIENGEKITFSSIGYPVIYIFERTDLKVEQFEQQIKDGLVVDFNDMIIGNWIWEKYVMGDIIYSYGKITTSKEYPNLFAITIKNFENENLISGLLCKGLWNSKNLYEYIGDDSPFGEYGKEEFEYHFDLAENDKIIITGKEFRIDVFGYSKWWDVIYQFKRTSLTLEQFEEELKAA